MGSLTKLRRLGGVSRIPFALLALATMLVPLHGVASPGSKGVAGSQKMASAPDPQAAARRERLDMLFRQLATAPDASVAGGIALRIEEIWRRSGSDTADLTFKRAAAAASDGKPPLGLDLLDFTIALVPDWAEAYFARAQIHAATKDSDAAMRDLRATLQREPRHYGALAGLGILLAESGDMKGAYAVLQRLQDIHPHFEDLAGQLDALRLIVEGQPI